jgi:hypothetical protein
MPSFLEKLKLSQLAQNPLFSQSTEGYRERDPVDRIFNELFPSTRFSHDDSSPRGRQGGNLNRIGNRMQFGTGPNDDKMLSDGTIIPGAPNVVYDPGPELAFKQAKQRDRQLDIQEKQVDALGGIKREDLDIKRERNAIADFKTRNPNLIIKATKGGNLIGIDPQTGDIVDTGVSTGTMSDAERLELTGNQKLEQIGVRGDIEARNIGERGAQSRLTAGVVGDEARKTAGVRGDETRETKGMETPLVGSQRMAEVEARAREALNQHPEWKDFIKIDNNGNVTVTKPRVGSQGLMSMFSGILGQDELTPEQQAGQKAQEALDDTTWREINKTLYEPRKVTIGESADPRVVNEAEKNINAPKILNPREQAADILRKQGKPVTPANIEFVMKKLAGG